MTIIAPRSSWTAGLGSTLAFGNWGALPFIIGALVEGAGFRSDKAAFLGALELVLMGGSMLAIAPYIQRINRAWLVGLALPLVVVAQLLSAYVTDYSVLLIIRALSGVGFGAIFSVGTAEGADAPEPDRAFGFATVVAMCCGIVKSPMLGYAKELLGYRGLFLSLSVYYLLVGLPFLLLLSSAGRGGDRPRAVGAIPYRRVPLSGALAVFLVMGAFSIATGGVFAFIERVADNVGISASTLGGGFAVSALTGTLGGVAANRLGLRVGRGIPTIGGFCLLGLISALLMNSPTWLMFWAAYLPWVIVHWFTYSYIMGLSVMIDPQGRIATLTSAVYILTGAAGAALAGILTREAGLGSYGWAALGACLAGAAAAGWTLREAHSLRPFEPESPNGDRL